jgi:hypothetical protein
VNLKAYLVALLILSASLFPGCISTKEAESTQKEEVEKKQYLTGVVYTEKEGVKEYDCSHKILACREDEIDGEKVLQCFAGDPVENLKITGGVTDYTLEKEEC